MTTGALLANLEALPPPVRRTIESADPDFTELHEGDERPTASVVTGDGRRVRIHSRAPDVEADRLLARAFPDRLPPIVAVIGAGLGYIVEAVQRRDEAAKIIVLEPFAALAREMLARRDWREWIAAGRLMLLVGPDYVGTADAGRFVGEQPVRRIEHPVLAREFPVEMTRARDIADRIIKGAELNAQARKAFAGRYLLNTLRNLGAIVGEGDVTALRGLFTGIPAVVVAAGPSLDLRLQQLATLDDRALIVAVDTTLRPLIAAGIRPHLVVAVDPTELNARHLLGLEPLDRSWLVSEGSIEPRALAEHRGHLFTFRVSDHQPWPWLRELGSDRGTLRAWGSVLTTAFDLAIEAGCNPIVFVGADLAYTNGLAYCSATIFDSNPDTVSVAERAKAFAEWLREQGRPTSMETDIRGEQTVSTPQFVQFRDWLVGRATGLSDRLVLNATGNGILQGGSIEQADLDSIAFPALPANVDLRGRIEDAWSESHDARTRRWTEIRQRFKDATADALPSDTWIEFAAGTITPQQILTALDIAVSEARLVSSLTLVADKAQPQAPGTTIVWTATPRGGTAPLEYVWTVYDGATWQVEQAWSSSNTFAWRPTVASTNWKVAVAVRSSGSPLADGELTVDAAFVTEGVSAMALEADKPSPQPMDTAVRWTAAARGGAPPYEYKWMAHDGLGWSVLEDWSASNTLDWRPSPNPHWRIAVAARSAGNTADDGEALVDVPFAVIGITDVTLSADRAAPQPLGTTITWTAAPSGGRRPYQYKWFIHDGTDWSPLSDWSDDNQFVWMPAVASPHWQIAVWTRSAGSDARMSEASAAIPFAISGATEVALVPDKEAPQRSGTPIRWTAAPVGGKAPYQFKWWVFEDNEWKAVTDWMTIDEFEWIPQGANPDWLVGVWVRSAGSAFDLPEASNGVAFPISDVDDLILTADAPGPQPIGTTITWTATARGSAAAYAFKWSVFNGTEWNVAVDWSSTSAFSWTPPAASIHWRVRAEVKSSGNSHDGAEARAELPVVITGVNEAELTPDRPAPQAPGTTIVWKATHVGGIAPHEYKWLVHDGDKWTPVTDWQRSPTFAWTPAQANPRWRVGVWVRSAGSPFDEREASTAFVFPIQ